ncbi:MAG: NAD(P)H-dependent oxidoreductase subunit E [Pseudomonadota bacterium]
MVDESNAPVLERDSARKDTRRKESAKPKGRQVTDADLKAVAQIIEAMPRRRDMLIEALHLIQDAEGHLSAPYLAALAELFRLSQVEVYEVASFYHHFDIVKQGEATPPPTTIRVCDSLSCAMAGAEALIADLEDNNESGEVRIQRVPCIGRCAGAPAAQIGKRAVDHATLASIGSTDDVTAVVPDYETLAGYREADGYRMLADVLSGEITPDSAIETMSDAGLRGLGGAGFPAGRKWSIVRSHHGPRLMTINGDEGEPGTFKDRHWLESQPHRMFEGAQIAARVVGCERVYIYMRDEYPAVIEILKREIEALETSDIDIVPMEIRRGAGAYICGEESAMIESIEGKRGLPRHRPPYIAEIGLFGRPTLNHNVETLAWVPDILAHGADWFAAKGKPDHPGLRSYSVSGRVKEPGVKLAPAGTSVRELIEDYSGGMEDGHTFKAYLPGGASGGILPASLGDIPLDFGDALFKHGAFVGSHAIVVLSDQDNIKDAVVNLMKFFEHESCGQCTPCRGGTEKMVKLLSKPGALDEDAIRDLEQVMRDASICGLGQAAPNPVNHLLTHFRDEI